MAEVTSWQTSTPDDCRLNCADGRRHSTIGNLLVPSVISRAAAIVEFATRLRLPKRVA